MLLWAILEQIRGHFEFLNSFDLSVWRQFAHWHTQHFRYCTLKCVICNLSWITGLKVSAAGPTSPTFFFSLRFVGRCLTIPAFTSLLSNGCERSDVVVDVIRRERRCRSLVSLSALAQSKDLRGLHQSKSRSWQRLVMKSQPLLQWSSSLLRIAQGGRWAYGRGVERRSAESLCLPEVVTRPSCASGDVPDRLE